MTTPREQEEYAALRATIRERGTARVWIFAAGLAIWGALLSIIVGAAAPPVAALVPLLVIASVFEAVFSLHVGAERIGRYLQVFHEDRWEQTVMDLGPPLAGFGADPLFTAFFGFAAIVNVLPLVAVQAVHAEVVVLAAAHALALVRIVTASRVAKRQRTADLERFRALRRP